MSESLESRLGQLRPREVSQSLEDRVARELEGEPAVVRHDRFFWSAVASGAIAACVVAGVLVAEPPRRPNAAAPIVDRSIPGPLTALARVDRRWGDELRLASDWSHP